MNEADKTRKQRGSVQSAATGQFETAPGKTKALLKSATSALDNRIAGYIKRTWSW